MQGNNVFLLYLNILFVPFGNYFGWKHLKLSIMGRFLSDMSQYCVAENSAEPGLQNSFAAFDADPTPDIKVFVSLPER